jgi:hypothetical protein
MTDTRPLGQFKYDETALPTATTLDLSAVTTPRVMLTGTTTIDAVTMHAWQVLDIIAAAGAAFTVNHHAGTLVLPNGGAGINVKAGDTFQIFADTSGGVTVRAFQRADGTPLAIDTDVTLAANSDAKVASQKAIKAYVSSLIGTVDAMIFKGVIDCSTNPNYPAADRGWTYRVSVAGKIGGASGVNVEAGDILICLTDGSAAGTQAAVGANWTIVQANVDGAVVGPAAAVSGNFPAFSGTSGKLIADSGVALDTDGTLAANSDAKLASQKAVKTYADAKKRHARNDKTGAYVIVQADMGSTVRGDATGGAFTITLPAAATNDGDFVTIRKSDSSANRITVQNNAAADVAWLSSALDTVTFVWWNSGWVVESWRIAPLKVVFTATGTLTKPPLATSVSYKLFGAGGGGGSGRQGATGAIRTGGGAGAGGMVVVGSLPASAVGATETITVAVQTTSAAAQASATTDGTAGTAGGTTNFGLGLLAFARGGNAGGAGSTANAAGGGAGAAGLQNYSLNGSGGGSSSTATAGFGTGAPTAGGGGGGSADAANVARLPGNGGTGSPFGPSLAAGVAGSSGVPGGNGVSASTDAADGGGGGGGGFYAAGVAGTAGGDGGAPGSGGGGGAASDNGSASGAGGKGARGEARFIWSFS